MSTTDELGNSLKNTKTKMKSRKVVANFDRGWDLEPTTDEGVHPQ